MLVITEKKDYVKVQKALEKIYYERQKLRKILGYRIQPQIGKVFDFLEKSLKIISRIKIVGDFSIENEVAQKAGINSSKDLKKFLAKRKFGLKTLKNKENIYRNKKKIRSKSISAKKKYLDYLKEVIEFLGKLAEVFCAHDYRISLTNAGEDCNLIAEIVNNKNPFFILAETLGDFLIAVEKNFGDINEEFYKKRAENRNFVFFPNIRKVVNDVVMYDIWFRIGEYKLIKKHYSKNYTDKKIVISSVYTFISQIITRHELLTGSIVEKMKNLIECPDEKNKRALIIAIKEWEGYKTISFDGRNENILKIIESLDLQKMSFKENCAKEKKNSEMSNENIERLKKAEEKIEENHNYIKDKITAVNGNMDSQIRSETDEMLHTIEAIG